MRLKFFHQHESVDCGPACLAMVAHHYGKKYSVRALKIICHVTRMGVSVKDIMDGSKEIGLIPSALKLTTTELEEIPLPAILFWKQEHFVVLYKVKKGNRAITYHLADPAFGKMAVDKEILNREWNGDMPKGLAIIFQLNPEKKEIKERIEKERYAPFLRPIFSFIRNHAWQYGLAIFLLLLTLFANWLMPQILGKIIDTGIVAKDLNIVWYLLVAQLGIFLGSFFSDNISNLILTKINFRLSNLIKNSLLNKLLQLPISYFDTKLNTDTLQRMGDQGKIQTFLTWKGIDLLMSSLNIIILSVLLLSISKAIFFVFLLLSVLSIIWVSIFMRLRSINEYALFIRQSENSNSTYEFIMHMPEIKVNSAHHKMISKLLEIQNKLNSIQLRSLYLNMYQIVGSSFLSRLKEIIAIAFCGFLIVNNKLTLGTLLSVTFILGQLAGPMQNLLNFIRDFQDADIARKRINDIYLESNEDSIDKLPVPECIEQIFLKNVSFKYPGSFNPYVLQNISFTIPHKKTTAIIGESGSGKTTLLKLLLSYYVPTDGSIILSQSSLSEINAEKWRQHCGIVLQDGHIFSGTILENIALADSAPDLNKVREAAQIACIDHFIDQLPMGYHTKTGNIGMQLSGGQKQRILIARAVYKNPSFLFFDEATSSLDANTEKAIVNNLQTYYKGKTVVIIAHRLSTVKNADKILVLKNGKIIETGTHAELTSAKGHYFNLVKNQLDLAAN